MRPYTKDGDKGKTSLVGDKRVHKNDIQVDAYGTIDELISHIGLVRSMEINHDWINRIYKFNTHENDIEKMLLEVQDKLMICASNVATKKGKMKSLPNIEESDILLLEQWIDMMDEKLPILNSFILPGGTVISAQCHIARTVCRRAERIVIGVTEEKEDFENNMVVKYLNRLSDFLFILARLLNVDKETIWIQKKGE